MGLRVLALLMLLSPSNCWIFDCSFYDGSWSSHGLIYTCRGQLLPGNSSLSLEHVQGSHEPGKTNDDVKGLSVHNNAVMTNFLKNIHTFFPNLSAIAWVNGTLKVLTASDLQPFGSNLKVFSLYRNKLSSVSGDLFKHSPKLKLVYFNYNLIETVGEDLLANLNELTNIYFEFNVCINMNANTQPELVDLKELLLAQCAPWLTTTEETTLATTTPPEHNICNLKCVINADSEELKQKLAEQIEINERNEVKIAELEKQIKELIEKQ